MKKKILVFVGHYLPGYKSGGPLRSIVNLIDHLSDDFDFLVVTRDRDIGDQTPYASIETDKWQTQGNVRVYYVSPRKATVRALAALVRETSCDIVYLNSFFDPLFTVKLLMARRFLGGIDNPIILAPRGEFSLGALGQKGNKKSVYIYAARLFGIYKDIIFQASTEYEKDDILRALGVAQGSIKVARNMPSPLNLFKAHDQGDIVRSNDRLKIVFISRLAPKKNLLFALKVLATVRAWVQFDIYGPKEDSSYWAECQTLIAQLPPNIHCRYCGCVAPVDVDGMFSRYDLFFFPTMGENYGHVIAESLSVGTPVLLSDQTPWRNLEESGLGWDFPLVSFNSFAEVIDNLSRQPDGLRQRRRETVRKEAHKRLLDPEVLQANRQLFSL